MKHKNINILAGDQFDEAVQTIVNHYKGYDSNVSEFRAMKELQQYSNDILEIKLERLFADLKREVEEARGNVLVGNLNLIRGNLEALACIVDNLSDMI